MNILLTGSGGFIGKNLKIYLRDKYDLLTPRSFELNLIDERAICKYFNENKIDFVIHCGSTGGAREIQDKETTITDNLAMVNNILKYKKKDVRVILFGSGAMYGKDRNLHKVKENEIGSYIPKDLYGQSKLKISETVKKRDDILMLNIFACYGYGEKENRFPSYAINQVLNNNPIEINQNCIYDYLWIEDMEKIVEYFIEHSPVDNIINITPTESISLLEIANAVNEMAGNTQKITIKNAVMNNEYTGSNKLLISNIKEFEFTSIKDGLRKLYEYKKNKLIKEKYELTGT